MHRRFCCPLTVLALLFATAVPGAAAVDLRVVSGTPQTERAWVAPRTNRYETGFAEALVVRVRPPATKVRFECVSAGCEFPAQEQPDSVSRAAPNAYDVTPAKGRAAIKLIVWTVHPRPVTVVAHPADAPAPQVRFRLDVR